MSKLVTLEEYKEQEGITSPKEDVRLDYIITSVSQLVKTYCGNSIVDYYETEKVEEISVDWPTSIVQLTESPLIDIISVQERDNFSAPYLTLSASDFYIDKITDSIVRVNGSSYKNWKTGPGAVKVTYNAGYESCPEDLKLAVYDLVTYYLKDEHKERRSLAGATVQNQSSTTQRNNVAFPDHIKRVLDLYKNF